MLNGQVKWFNDQKGYGFIAAQGKDYFVHYKEIQATGFKSLKEGDKVQFESDSSPKGPIARLVSRLEDEDY